MALVTIVYSLFWLLWGLYTLIFVKTIQISSPVIHKSIIFLFLSNFPTHKALHDLRARFLRERESNLRVCCSVLPRLYSVGF